jgi:hypothetical protein
MSEETREVRWPARNARNTKLNLAARQIHGCPLQSTQYSFSGQLKVISMQVQDKFVD